MGTVTMKHLAHDLGVSVTTVSNAYNKPDRLSVDLRSKILARGEELGYYGPDAAGRLLRSGRAHAIGVLTTGAYSYLFRDSYARTIFEAVSEELERCGYALTMFPTTCCEGISSAVQNTVVDAVISLTAAPGGEAADLLKRRGLRIIHGHRVDEGEYVAVDDFLAGRAIAEYVCELGHQRAVIVSHDVSGTQPHLVQDAGLPALCATGVDEHTYWADRLQGMAAGLGDSFAGVVATPGASSHAAGRAAAAFILDSAEPRPTAAVCLSDRLALGVLAEVEQRGLIPGRDITITGYDAVDAAVQAGITSLSQPIDEKGRLTAQLAMDPDPTITRIDLPFEISVGRTSGPPPR